MKQKNIYSGEGRGANVSHWKSQDKKKGETKIKR